MPYRTQGWNLTTEQYEINEYAEQLFYYLYSGVIFENSSNR